jgi:hypothetical protein
MHVYQRDLTATPPHVLDHNSVVGYRVGVGHGEHGRVAAERGRGRTCLDGLGVLAPRLTQMCVQVDESRQRHEPVGLDGLPRPVAEVTDLGDLAVLDKDVDGVTFAVGHGASNQRHATSSSPASRW